MPVEDPTTWLTRLLKESYKPAVDSLLGDGVDLAVKAPPAIGAPEDRRPAGSARNRCRVHVHEGSDIGSQPRSWGDTDRDLSLTMTIRLEAAGANARGLAESAILVIDRFLALHRKHPHPEWDRFDSWRRQQIDRFPDFERHAFTIILSKHGERFPTPVVDL